MRASAIAARAMAEPGAFPPPPRDHARRRNELWREQAEYLGGVLERRLAAAEQRRLPPPPSRRSHLVRPRSPARFEPAVPGLLAVGPPATWSGAPEVLALERADDAPDAALTPGWKRVLDEDDEETGEYVNEETGETSYLAPVAGELGVAWAFAAASLPPPARDAAAAPTRG